MNVVTNAEVHIHGDKTLQNCPPCDRRLGMAKHWAANILVILIIQLFFIWYSDRNTEILAALSLFICTRGFRGEWVRHSCLGWLLQLSRSSFVQNANRKEYEYFHSYSSIIFDILEPSSPYWTRGCVYTDDIRMYSNMCSEDHYTNSALI